MLGIQRNPQPRSLTDFFSFIFPFCLCFLIVFLASFFFFLFFRFSFLFFRFSFLFISFRSVHVNGIRVNQSKHRAFRDVVALLVRVVRGSG